MEKIQTKKSKIIAYRTALNDKIATWMALGTSPQSFRFVFTIFYIGITGIIAYYNELWRPGTHFVFWRNVELGFLLILLLALENFEHRRYRDGAPFAIALGLLIIRMALFEGIVALDNSGVSLFLYPIIPFNAYFAFGAKASISLSIIYLLTAVKHMQQVDAAWYLNADTTSMLVSFIFVLFFMQVATPVIKRDEESRRRTQELLADLRASHLKLQLYAAHVADLAATEERNRLARDIHDSLGHYLTVVNIQLEKALAYRDRDAEQATQAIRDAKHAAAEALKDVRHSVSTLRDDDEQFVLQTALQALANRMNNAGLTVDLTMTGSEAGYSRPVLLTLYRAAQEGLTNIQKHAKANRVTLEMHFEETLATLCLKDNGQGFDTSLLEQPPAELGKFGLQGIRERVELVSGRMSLQSQQAQGTEIVITVPKNPTELITGDWVDLQISHVEEA